MSKLNVHKGLCDTLFKTYAAKNNDYGDSYAKVRAKYPASILVRLNDKMSRLETLLTGTQQQVADESIDDTLIDIANYCLLELVERICDKDMARTSEVVPTPDADELEETRRALRLGKMVIDSFDVGKHDILQVNTFGDCFGTRGIFVHHTGTCEHFNCGNCDLTGKMCCSDPNKCDFWRAKRSEVRE